MKRDNTGGKDGWDPERYLNIWICDLATTSGGGMVLGYSYLPGLPWWQNWKDGLVVGNAQLHPPSLQIYHHAYMEQRTQYYVESEF